MEELTKLFLNFLEIMEAELKLFRLNTAKTLKGIGWVGMGIFLLGIGFLFFAWTIFQGLTILIGKVGAGLLTSLFILMVGGIFIWRGGKTLK